ncbi:MAG: C25 family cysteine peptidase, partial [bacterium]
MARKPALCPASLVCLLIGLVLLSSVVPSSHAETLSYSLTLPLDDVRVGTELGYTTIQVSSSNYELFSEEGSPELPFRIVNVLLPQGQLIDSFSFVAGPGVVLTDAAKVKTAGASVTEDGTVGKGASLVSAPEEATTFPGTYGRYLGTGFLHGRAIASFAVFPLELNGSELALHQEIRLDIVTVEGADKWKPVVRERYRKNFQEKVARTLSGFVINPDLNAGYHFDEVKVEKKEGGFQPTSYPSLEGSPVDYLIITTDALAAEFQRLADWKTEKGVPTVVRTVEFIEANTRNGVDLQETIRNFIKDAYAKWGITYVLLGGDTDVLPPRYALSRFYLGGTELPVDMYFSCLDGSWNDTHDKFWGEGVNVIPFDNPDLYPELYNGRAPFSTTSEVSTMIDKIIAYETPCDMSYQDKYLFLAEVLFPVDWKDPDPISLNGADFAQFVDSNSLSGKPLDVVKMFETD